MNLNYNDWTNEVRELLSQLRTIDFGYPLGENVLREPSNETVSIGDNEMAEFYSHCDGLSWPDVANGYFIRRSAEFGKIKNEYDPSSIDGDLNGEITVLGSTGTGVLFARRIENDQILALPPSTIKASVYHNSDSRAKIIASSPTDFFLKIKEDLDAFVKDKAEHQYLA